MNTPRIPRVFADGTLAGTTLVKEMAGAAMPCSLTLKSAAGGRKIEISTDGGSEYFTPVYDTNTATMLVVVVRAPISHVRFTGAVSDFWRIQ